MTDDRTEAGKPAQAAEPLALRLNDQLGPLPEPAYGLAKRDSDDPAAASLGPWYSLDDMRDYAAQNVAAERERCAKLCDVSADVHWGAWDEHADPTDQGAAMEAERLALEIRGPNANLTGTRSAGHRSNDEHDQG